MAGMTTLAPLNSGLLLWYDALDEDPPGYRLEILEEVLVVAPAPSEEHQERAVGFATLLEVALDGTGLRAVPDIEWPLEHPVAGLGSRLRPDVSVFDPEDPHGSRIITVEVVSPSDGERPVPGQPETRIEGKRRVYAYGGAAVHIEVQPVDGTVEVRWYALVEGRFVLAGSARGSEPLKVGGPHPFSVVPDELSDWARRRVRQLEAAAERERERAERERERADQERGRADRAEAELRRLRGGG